MTITHTAAEIRDWSESDFDALVGRDVQITVGDDAPCTGTLIDACDGDEMRFVRFEDGTNIAWWRHSDEVTITVEPIGDQP